MNHMTHAMTKGSNVRLEATTVRAVLHWVPAPGGAPDVDVSALLLGADGRVRSDDDFIFYNQPQHPSGQARHLSKAQTPDGLTDGVEADLAGLAGSVQRVVLAASADGGSFADVGRPVLTLHDPRLGAEPLISFAIEPETGAETAMVLGELYRRGEDWKFRALGQGYDTGLVALAAECGVAVEDGAVAGGGTVPAPPSEPDIPEPDPVPEPGPEPRPAPDPGPLPGPGPRPGPEPQPPEPQPEPAGAATVVADQQATQPAYGYPPQPQHPPVAPPAYGYPQPVYGHPQDGRHGGEGDGLLPPQGPQFLGR